MAKRFTDSEKWKKQWFRKLTPVYKCLWVYICDNCNIAGIWDVDFELASFMIGSEIDVEMAKEDFKKQYTDINSGSKWLIKDFVSFQYGSLVPNNNLHRSVLSILNNSGANEPLTRGSGGDKDKVKVKDKVIKGGMGGFDFDALWKQYPRKLGKDDARRHFNAQVKTEQDYKEIGIALNTFLKSKQASGDPQYIPHGGTWFNHKWRDWVNYQEPQTPQEKEDAINRQLFRA